MARTRYDAFRAHVTAGERIAARLALTGGGRNAGASRVAIERHYLAAHVALLDASRDPLDPLPEHLDSPAGATLAARYRRLEDAAARNAGASDEHDAAAR